jgi:hypothetical protein
MLTTPFSGVLSSVAIEHGKEALPPDAREIDDEGVCIFHIPPCALVLRHTNLKRGVAD